MNCPNKNTPEFKMLTKQLGTEQAAIYTWHMYGDKYPPNLKSLAELKKELGVRNNVSKYTMFNIAKKIKAYNDKYGTSHSFEAVQKGQSESYDILFTPNYLHAKNAQKMHTEFTANSIPVVDNSNSYGVAGTISNVDFSRESNEFFVDGELYPTEIDARDNMLFQNQDDILGAFDTTTNIIYGLTNPNITTFPHELAHAFFEHSLTTNSDISKTTIEWVNENKNTDYSTDWSSLNKDQRREVHEAFADGFTLYLAEGRNTTDTKINNIFAQFAKWLKNFIDQIKITLGIELNDNMRSVYNQLLGLEEIQEVYKPQDITTQETNINNEVEQVDDSHVISNIYEEEEGFAVVNIDTDEVVGYIDSFDDGITWVDPNSSDNTQDFKSKKDAAKNIINVINLNNTSVEQVLNKDVIIPTERAWAEPEDFTIVKKQNEDSSYTIKNKTTEEIIGYVYKEGDLYVNVETEEDYDSLAEAFDFMAGDYNDKYNLNPNDVREEQQDEYYIITTQDKDGKDIYVTAKFLETEVDKSSNITLYKLQDIHGDIYINDTKGNLSNEEDFLNSPKIEKPTPKYEIGSIVAYTDPLTKQPKIGIIKSVVTRVSGVVYSLDSTESPVTEAFINSLEEEIVAEKNIGQSELQEKQKRAIFAISAKFQELFGHEFKVVESAFDFNGLARFNKGKIELNVAKIIQQDYVDIPNLVVHEFMHPFIHALRMSNVSLYNNLLDELKVNGTYSEYLAELNEHIKEEGKASPYYGIEQKDIDDEILTRYLGENISEIFNENGSINEQVVMTSARDLSLINQFISWLKHIVDVLLGNKNFRNWSSFIKDISKTQKSTLKDLLGGSNGLYARYPEIKDSIDSFGNKQLFSNYEKLYERLLNNRPVKDSTITVREKLQKDLEHIPQVYEQIINSITQSNIIYEEGDIDTPIDISINTDGSINVIFNSSLKNSGKTYFATLKTYIDQEIEANPSNKILYSNILSNIENSYYQDFVKKDILGSNSKLTINELNPLMKLQELTSVMKVSIGRDHMIDVAGTINRRNERNETLVPVANKDIKFTDKRFVSRQTTYTVNILGVDTYTVYKDTKSGNYIIKENNHILGSSEKEARQNILSYHNEQIENKKINTGVTERDLLYKDEIYRYYKDVTFPLSFTSDELQAVNTLTAYMAVSDKSFEITRDKVVKNAERLFKVANNYRSDTLKYEANRFKYLNNQIDKNDSATFTEYYMEEAAKSLGIAYRKYMDIVSNLKDRQGDIGREELKRYNKELIVVRQLISYHDQFERLVQLKYGEGTENYEKYRNAFVYINNVKDTMEDTAIASTIEWLLPYANQHNKYMKEAGYTTDEYMITPETLRNHFKYGFGDDVGYISYWLGSNVTSRNAINALVANTINQDLMITNVAVHDASMDINIAFRDFLNEQGLANLTSSATTDYYKKNFLRKARVLTRRYDETLLGEYVEEYEEKWAIHRPFLEDKFEEDLKRFTDNLPEPKTQDQANENLQKTVEWKKKKGLTLNPKTGEITNLNSEYINKDYEKVKDNRFFKVLEEKYKQANNLYGENKLKYGIVPQKFNENAISKLRNALGSTKDEKGIKKKLNVLRDKILKEYEYSTDDNTKLNFDDTEYRPLNTTLTSFKNEENLNLSLHELITDFVGEGERYKALSNTQYNAENLMLLLTGNKAFEVGVRGVSTPDHSLNLDVKKRYNKAKEEINYLDKAKEDGVAIDTTRYDKLITFIENVEEKHMINKKVVDGKVVDGDFVDMPVRDKIFGRTVTPSDAKANKMLIAQINHIYFGRDIDDWNIKWLKNASAASVAQSISMYESIIRMGGNVIAAANNVTMGNLHMFIEAIGGKYYDNRTLLKASANYMGNIHNYFMDTKNPIKTKDAQLAIMWDAIQGEIQDEFGKRVTGSLASKFFRSGSFFFLTAAGEHQIQLTNMKAMALYRKVKTKSGEEISLYDAYQKDVNGRYKLRTDLENFNQEDLLKFMRDLQGVNRMLNGNYSDFNKTMLQRKWYGNLIMKFRKWMYTSVRARWANERVDYERNTIEVGYYKQMLNYLVNGAKRMIKREGGFDKISDMKPHERYAMRKGIAEIGFYLALTLLASVMFGGDDEPKDLNDYEKFALLMMVRLHADLEIYHAGIPNIILYPIPGVEGSVPNPFKEPMKILGNPSASMNTIRTFTKVLEGLDDPGAVYQQSGAGYKKGENKMWIQGRKLLPFKQFMDLYEGRFIGTMDNQLGYFEMVNKGIEGVTARKSNM